MPTYDVNFYLVDALSIFGTGIGDVSTYTGPASQDGFVTITDNGTGIEGATLEDHKKGETATGDSTIGGVSATGDDLSAERSWALLDLVTGETFQIVRFEIRSGANQGSYLLTERPLVVGRSYETVAYDKDPDAVAGGDVFTYADYVPEPDGIVSGTAGDDTIDANYAGDPELEKVDNNDAVGGTPPVASEFNWTDYTDEQDLRAGVTQDTGDVSVTVTYTDVQTTEEFSAELSGGTDAIYVAPGEPFNTTSAAYVFANGSADNTTVTFDFAANTTGYEDGVKNVQFRISDIDGLSDGSNNFQDIVTVNAYDVNGKAIDVTITGGSNHTVVGNTVTASLSNGSASDESGSALFEIAGPVAQIEVIYDNGGTTQQAIYISDIHFDAIPQGADDDVIQAGDGNDSVLAGYGDDSVDGGVGNDTIWGGEGADTLHGESGADTLYVGSGDTATGGAGDDTFLIDGDALNGSAITITGGETEEATGDVLDFNGTLAGPVTITVDGETAGGKSGTATLTDGTVVTFSEIESIICFTEGAGIDTPYGARPVQALKPGDSVLTRDHGPQKIRWIGRRRVPGIGDLAPIRFAAGAIGNASPFEVSPQHRMLIGDYRTMLYFGEEEVLVPARHLVDGKLITQVETAEVRYHHILFDNHEIVRADGVWSESYQPGSYSLSGLDPRAREELFETFPSLRANPVGYGPSARRSMDRHGARMLAAA